MLLYKDHRRHAAAAGSIGKKAKKFIESRRVSAAVVKVDSKESQRPRNSEKADETNQSLEKVSTLKEINVIRSMDIDPKSTVQLGANYNAGSTNLSIMDESNKIKSSVSRNLSRASSAAFTKMGIISRVSGLPEGHLRRRSGAEAVAGPPSELVSEEQLLAAHIQRSLSNMDIIQKSTTKLSTVSENVQLEDSNAV